MHPVSRQHLDDANPCQNSSGERIKRADSDDGARVVAIELVKYTDTDGHADGCDDREETGHQTLLQCGGCSAREFYKRHVTMSVDVSHVVGKSALS
jgi:hypothetical protein